MSDIPTTGNATEFVTERIDKFIGRRGEINRELSRNGVRFGIYKNGEYHDRLFPFDPIPRIIPSDEFDELEAGLKQRVTALNAFLRDVYSDKAIVKDGVIPEEYVYTSAGYLPQVNGMTPPAGVFAHIAGEDLVQGQDGRWWVLEDNLRIPSGASYPLFVRDIERRIDPHLFRDVHVRDNREYPQLLRASMDFVSAKGINVVLTPGRYNSAFFEHSYLAEKIGAVLAFPEDLEVQGNKVYFIDYAGRRHRVGAVYRRLSDEYLDPFAFNPDSVIGVPGLLGAYRAGNVAIINAPGNGVADDKAMYYFVPRMIEYYLHEKPILHNAPTYMPMFEKDRATVLDRLGELVIKDVAEAGGYGVVFGSSLDAHGLEEMRERIIAEPRRFIAQEVIQFRDLDVVDPDTGEHVPRKADLRAFVVTGKDTSVWYSGLTRYSSVPGQMIVNSSQGGGFKDTWVLAPKDAEALGTIRPGRPMALASDSAAHSSSLITASKAESLYWLGRYTERVFTTLNRFFPFYDRVMDTNVEAFRPFAEALDLPTDFKDFDAFVHSFLYDASDPNSVVSAMKRAFEDAIVLRPMLGSKAISYIEMALIVMGGDTPDRDESDIYRQRDITDIILTFWGSVENSGVAPLLKSFLFIGKYIERLELYTRLGGDDEETRPALDKLMAYCRLVSGNPLPRCYCDGLQWLVDHLPQRGYPALAHDIESILQGFSNVLPEATVNGSMMAMSQNTPEVRDGSNDRDGAEA